MSCLTCQCSSQAALLAIGLVQVAWQCLPVSESRYYLKVVEVASTMCLPWHWYYNGLMTSNNFKTIWSHHWFQIIVLQWQPECYFVFWTFKFPATTSQIVVCTTFHSFTNSGLQCLANRSLAYITNIIFNVWNVLFTTWTEYFLIEMRVFLVWACKHSKDCKT